MDLNLHTWHHIVTSGIKFCLGIPGPVCRDITSSTNYKVVLRANSHTRSSMNSSRIQRSC